MSTGKFAVQIGGAAVTVPGVYIENDKSAMVAQRGVPKRALAIIASAKGGYVGGVTRVMAGDEARLLRGGVGAQMARAAFNHGMTEVFFIRVDKALPALLDLNDVILQSVNPGRPANALQAKTAPNATRPDALDLYLKDASGAERDETYRMIGPMLDLTYVGDGSQPTGTVTYHADTDTVTLHLQAEGDPGASLDVDTTTVPTVAELVEAINRSGTWSARAVGHPATPTNVAKTMTLTFSSGTATVYGGGRLVSLLLAAAQSRIAFGVPTTSTSTMRVTGNYEFFSGGTDGPLSPSTQDYIDALRLAEKLPVTGIALGSGDYVVAAALSSHLESLSGVKARRERFGSVGIAPQITKSGFMQESLLLGQLFSDVSRMVIAGNTPFDFDVQTNQLTEQHAAVLGAAALAIKISGKVAEPLTNKRLRFTKLRHNYSTEDLEDLIEGGVMPAQYDEEQGANIIVQGITTYVADNNMMLRKLAAVDISDYINKKIRQRVTSLSVGKVADEARVKVILQSVKALLQEEVRGTRNPDGVLTPGIDPDTNQPVSAFRNMVAVFDGADMVGVDVDLSAVGEVSIVRVRPRWTPVRIEARA